MILKNIKEIVINNIIVAISIDKTTLVYWHTTMLSTSKSSEGSVMLMSSSDTSVSWSIIQIKKSQKVKKKEKNIKSVSVLFHYSKRIEKKYPV